MKVVAIIQARMGSTRLPGKVLRTLNGKTVLARVIERVRACALVDLIVVATTTGSADDVIVEETRRSGAQIFRGSEEDVLSRYLEAAQVFGADVVVRITSDCPLFDPAVLTRMLEAFQAAARSGRRIDYMSNALERTYPRGLDAEIFPLDVLAVAHEKARLPHEKEHVTPYIYQHPSEFILNNYTDGWGLQQHRWTLDTDEDWALISGIYNAFPGERIFTTAEVVALLDRRPELASLNAGVVQKPVPGSAA
jgi:spore coat polysaccharide biosynthesis protein SpsF